MGASSNPDVFVSDPAARQMQQQMTNSLSPWTPYEGPGVDAGFWLHLVPALIAEAILGKNQWMGALSIGLCV